MKSTKLTVWRTELDGSDRPIRCEYQQAFYWFVRDGALHIALFDDDGAVCENAAVWAPGSWFAVEADIGAS